MVTLQVTLEGLIRGINLVCNKTHCLSNPFNPTDWDSYRKYFSTLSGNAKKMQNKVRKKEGVGGKSSCLICHLRLMNSSVKAEESQVLTCK